MYEKVRERIRTNEDFIYHDSVVAYSDYESPYSFYLLGFEKPRDGNNIRPYCRPAEINCKTPAFAPTYFKGSVDDDMHEIGDTRQDIEKNIFNDSRPLVLTHILNVRKKVPTKKECFVFNVYGDASRTPWCKNHHKAALDKADWKREGWYGLGQLATEIHERIAAERATHLILLFTGWNTRQYESYRDFSKLMENIGRDFRNQKAQFRPIYIGVSWESEWPKWADNIPIFGSTVSQPTKGNDADEIGFTWINFLLNDLLRPVARESSAKIVLIGHSFGSRIALGSHYTRDILIRSDPVADIPITVVGMQAAFPVARFVSSEGKEHQYVAHNKGNAAIVITSSKSDSATGTMCFGTKYVGAGCGLKELTEDPRYGAFVQVLPSTAAGLPQGEREPSKVSVYDASPFVNCQLSGTSSGSHSDIYDLEMGHFLGEIIRGTVPPN